MSLYPGLKVGDLKLIQRTNASAKGPYWSRKKWRVECVCGKRLTIPEMYLTRKEPKTHCGCRVKTIKTIHNEEFRIWLMMHQRCESPNHVAYKHYGGRGIKICERWHKSDPKGFENFLADVGPRPSPGHSIDRIDPDGPYALHHPHTGALQVRWATAKEQAQTTRAAIARKRK